MNVRSAVIAAVLGSTLASARTVSAQADSSHWSVLVPSGFILPTGEQRHAIKRGNVSAIQLSFAPRPTFAITSMVGWARSRDVASVGDPKLDVFTYDIGAETRAPRWIEGKGMSFTPFAGLGAGGRSYNYRSLDVGATHNVGAYVSAGGDLRVRRVGIRLEARDYVTEFKPLSGAGDVRSGNDVVLMAGLRIFSR